ncbi:Protein ABIL3 [Hibiscus syriacus]|uniref:Protein ABIL3 n=1 Tax=Hibiscus syriacus TaxID=106335 RepID=A0A6A3BUQ0_HIBSY|nr:Protein ABIL3 [Hibiscus syriacus]
MPMSREESYYEEVSTQQSLLFSDSLEDLKNLRTQLYSAAEYFELSYTNDDHKQIVVETLKDYAIKAIVNTIDHLGSVTYKVNDFMEEKVDEVSGTELQVSCVEESIELQRVQNCQKYIDREGISQQSSMIITPKYHKRIRETRPPPSSFKETSASSIRKGRSPSPSPRPLQRSATFSFTATMPKKELEKRTGSPRRFPRLSFGSDSRATTPKKSRSSTPNSAGARQRCPSEPRKSAVMHRESDKDNAKDIEQYPSKSKRLLKAFFSRRKSKKDDMLYTFLDEY